MRPRSGADSLAKQVTKMAIYRYLVNGKAKNKTNESVKLTLRHASEEELERQTINALFKKVYGEDLKDIAIDNVEIIIEPRTYKIVDRRPSQRKPSLLDRLIR